MYGYIRNFRMRVVCTVCIVKHPLVRLLASMPLKSRLFLELPGNKFVGIMGNECEHAMLF